LLELYRRVRPGDPPSVDNARNLLQSLFFNPRRFDLGRVGRYKVDKRLGRDEEDILDRVKKRELRILEKGDFIAILRKLIELNNAPREKQIPDDIDHLGNRRVRAVGELLQNQFRMGLIRMERIIKERMTISDPHTVTSASLINARPVVAAIKEFFGSSQLSQFMDQHNPLSELTHKRRLSALGPGGLSRERAGFDVRDVHHSHYGRICPIETPEGPNIGLIGNLATYAKVNEFGFIETPFRRVYNRVALNDAVAEKLEGRSLRRPAVDSKGTEVMAAHEVLDAKAIQKLMKAHVTDIAHPKELKTVHATPVFEIVVKPDGSGAERHYPLQKFARSNQGTCLNHRAVVKPGQHVEVGDILADGPAIDQGEMALGRNVL